MKSLKLTLALCALAAFTKAQPLTGQSYYAHGGTTSILSSGTRVSTNPGFIMAGYRPTTSGSLPNFLIDKVDVDGKFTSAGRFSTTYILSDGGKACSDVLTAETNCYGVSIIENPGTSSALYALTGAFDAGILFATIDNTGAVVSKSLYNIPTGATPNSKPVIALSAGGAGYYMAGSYKLSGMDYMYVIKVNSTGGNLWSSVYTVGAQGSTCTPHAILEDSYPGFAELAIAGTIGGSVTTDGFLMTLNGSTGSPMMQLALASGLSVNESISSIALAPANSGYILGGSTDMSSGSGRAWMLNLNASGSINWSRRINPTTNTTAGEVVGVAQRFSSVYSAYEYYGLTVSGGSAGGMMVLKLNQAGSPFSKTGNTRNEFVYNNGSTIAVPSSISLLDAGSSGPNTGLHVFGTTQAAPSQFFMDQACFNGATGNCISTSQQNLTAMISAVQGPTVTYTYSLTTVSGLVQCRFFSLTPTAITYNPAQPCSMTTLPTTPYPGNNSRTMDPTTGIAESNNDINALSVFPNPVSSAAEINYTAAEGGEVTISLSDILGQQIKTLDKGYKNAGLNTLSFDMNSLNLQTGVYFINVTINGATSQKKIIFNKN